MSFALPAPNKAIPLSDRWWLLPRFRGQEVDRDPKPTEPSTAKIMRERLSHSEATAYREQLAA